MNRCKICQAQGDHPLFKAREMMLGTRQPFVYFKCNNCGCLQIESMPDNMGEYYPKDYYSFGQIGLGINPVISHLKRKRLKVYFGNSDGVYSRLVSYLYPCDNPIFMWLKKANVNSGSRILDVGCGSGGLLVKLYKEGFTEAPLVGIDPFIEESRSYTQNLRIVKTHLGDLSGEFDIVMLHHSFEHMAKPREVMCSLKRLLARKGTILIRIPVSSSYAWEKYNTDWVQLDAPRHYFLHTPKSISLVCKMAGLKIVETIYDSSKLQFIGSELYRRDIPLRDRKKVVPKLFSKSEIKEFERMAKILNAEGRGDQAGFLITHL